MQGKVYKIPLVNVVGHEVLLDEEGYNAVMNDPYLTSINFLKSLRAYSKTSGYPFFQKSKMRKDGKQIFELVFLHHWLAERFLKKPETDKRLFLTSINGNRLDCRIKNLQWVTRSEMSRRVTGSKSRLGYRGVTKEHNRYRANLYDKGVDYFLGYYSTAEEAAEAYNKKSTELFGETASLNKITPRL